MLHKRPEEITAELKSWTRGSGLYKNVFWGYVYGDVKKRFRDGAVIHTSSVVNVDEYDDCFIVTTLNSVYKMAKCDRCEDDKTHSG